MKNSIKANCEESDVAVCNYPLKNYGSKPFDKSDYVIRAFDGDLRPLDNSSNLCLDKTEKSCFTLPD